MKEFTPEDLAQFNGQDDRPAYVAMNGKVYDVSGSKLWRKGQHMKRHDAGTDLSASLAQAPHGEEVLERVTQVGVIQSAAPARSGGDAPAWAQWLLAFHPHPILVHFPQAFLSFAPVFLILFYALGNPSFERTAFYLLVTGSVMAVPTIATGFFHWIYKYARAAGGVYKFKIWMSLVALVFSACTAAVHAARGVLPAAPVDIPVLALYLGIVPLIAALGHAGGIIVFGGRKQPRR